MPYRKPPSKAQMDAFKKAQREAKTEKKFINSILECEKRLYPFIQTT